MIRSPLRPLISILKARHEGINPDIIENQEKAKRLKSTVQRAKSKARQRIFFLSGIFFISFAAVCFKMTMLASTIPEISKNSYLGYQYDNRRAAITDRNGVILATNLATKSLYVHPHEFIDKEKVARGISGIFPDLKFEYLVKIFRDGRKYFELKKRLSPEQRQAVRDLGEPGIYFGNRETRLYPNGNFAAHILGGSTFGGLGVHSAELIGEAGVELFFNSYLSDPLNVTNPLSLSIDFAVQGVIEKVLDAGIAIMNARGGSAVLMNAHNGKIISLASLPDFDPNHRPPLPLSGDPSNSPLFNRAAQGVYELGSIFKIFTAAQALELGIAGPETIIDIRGPLYLGGNKPISDLYYLGDELTLSDIIIKSSNIGTAKLAWMIGGEKQRQFFKELGLLDLTGVELPEASRAQPQFTKKISRTSTATFAYGHGISVTPLHLATAYSMLVNGGTRVRPTVTNDSYREQGQKILVSPATSLILQRLLTEVVEIGTAKGAKIKGYSIGGKTGTAEKVNFISGGYIKNKVIATFVAVFPMESPKYVLVVTLDEPEDRNMDKPVRTAGRTAVPVAREIINRIAPILGVAPILPTTENISLNTSF